jgi:hypothetical protein
VSSTQAKGLLMAGESADVDIEKAKDFTVYYVLPVLIERNTAEDIYNADETGSFL